MLYQMKLDEEISAVVVGTDTSFDYTKLSYASIYIQKDSVKFIATNEDAFLTVEGGRKMPSAGSLIEPILLSIDDVEGN